MSHIHLIGREVQERECEGLKISRFDLLKKKVAKELKSLSNLSISI